MSAGKILIQFTSQGNIGNGTSFWQVTPSGTAAPSLPLPNSQSGLSGLDPGLYFTDNASGRWFFASDGIPVLNVSTEVVGPTNMPAGCYDIEYMVLPASLPTAPPLDLRWGPAPGLSGLLVLAAPAPGNSIFAHINYRPGQPASSGINQYQAGICCVHEDSEFSTANGKTVRAKDLRAGDIVLDRDGRPTPLLYNVRYLMPTQDFFKIAKNALGENLPSRDLLIREGHPVLYRGREVEVQKLPTDVVQRVQLDEPAFVYTPVTAKRTFVNVQGVPVATWSKLAWENFANHDERGKHMSWVRQ